LKKKIFFPALVLALIYACYYPVVLLFIPPFTLNYAFFIYVGIFMIGLLCFILSKTQFYQDPNTSSRVHIVFLISIGLLIPIAIYFRIVSFFFSSFFLKKFLFINNFK